MDRRRRQPVSLASPQSEVPRLAGTFELGGLEAQELKDEVKHDNLRGLREYLARTRKEGDWQDRVFMLELVVPDISPGILNEACDSEPGAPSIRALCEWVGDHESHCERRASVRPTAGG
jgi:hypothetical protein